MAFKKLSGHRATVLRTLATFEGVKAKNMVWVPHHVLTDAMYADKPEFAGDRSRVLRVTLHTLRRVVGQDSIVNNQWLGYALVPGFDASPWLKV